MLTLLVEADILEPRPLGVQDVLVAGGKIAKVGSVDREAFAKLASEADILNLDGCYLVPGFIDPHVHLLGGSGERGGFSTQSPAPTLTEFTTVGTTTVVGTIGTDTTTKTMLGLLSKTKAMREQGLSAYMYTGGYRIPPASLLQTVREDIMLIDEAIGVGEIAVADERASEPTVDELARIASDAHVAGMLSGKAGISHFHIGPGWRGLQSLIDLLDNTKYEVRAAWLYPTHVNRSEKTVRQGIQLAEHGAFIDFDTVDEDLVDWLKMYLDESGSLKKLTLSSDCSLTSPGNLFSQLRHCVLNEGFELAQLLPLITSNTAQVLKLIGKGTIAAGADADFVVLDKNGLEIRHVMASGRWMVRDGVPVVRERFLKDSNRFIQLKGEKYPGETVYARD